MADIEKWRLQAKNGFTTRIYGVVEGVGNSGQGGPLHYARLKYPEHHCERLLLELLISNDRVIEDDQSLNLLFLGLLTWKSHCVEYPSSHR